MTPRSSSQPHKSQPRNGFTLIELLIVIAIIGILAAMLLPVLSRVRARSRQATCTSHLKQIGQALEIYRSGWRDRFPLAERLPSGGGPLPSLRQALAAQLSDPDIWRCPDDPTFYDSEGLSYEWNSFVNGVVWMESVFYGLTGGNPAALPLLGDYDPVHGGGKARNVLFADGHVEEVR